MQFSLNSIFLSWKMLEVIKMIGKFSEGSFMEASLEIFLPYLVTMLLFSLNFKTFYKGNICVTSI